MFVFILLLIPVGLLLMMFGIRYWRETVIAVLFWSVFEGGVRKWLFPQFQAPILQMKDIALIAAYLGFLAAPKAHIPDDLKIKAVATLFLIQSIYCFLEVLNPALPNAILGFYGLKTYLIYTPLVFLMPYVIRDRAELKQFLFWACVIAIGVGLLALFQFSQPPDSWINRYVSHEENQIATATVFGEMGAGDYSGGRARTAGTFSYIGGFTTFLLAMVPLSASILMRERSTRRETMLAGAALVLSIGATLTTGSRAPFVIFAFVAPLVMFVGAGRGLIPLGTALRLTSTMAILGVASLALFSGATTAFMYRAQNSDSTMGRMTSPFTEWLQSCINSPIFGIGIGSNSNAAATLVSPDFYWLPFVVEGEPARIVQDLGVGGFVVVYALKATMVFYVIKWLFWSRSKLFLAMYLALASFLVPHVILVTVNNPTAGLYFWAFSGIALSMYRIERGERAAAVRRMQLEAADERGRSPVTA